MTVDELEDLASQNAERSLDLLEAGDMRGLTAHVAALDRQHLAWLVLTLAHSYLEVESENGDLEARNGILRRQNEVLEQSNQKLFADRRSLMDKNQELREIIGIPARRAA